MKPCPDFQQVRLCSCQGTPSSGEKRRVGDGVWLNGMSRPLPLTGLIGKDSQDPTDRRTAVDSPQDFSKSQEGSRGEKC